MSSNTKRIHRLLLLWLDLQKAVHRHQTRHPSGKVLPWDSPDPETRNIWKRLTDPENEQGLEEWMFQVADGEQTIWAQHALLECRQRAKKS
ncbi:MAG TPA: hypothetical protein VK327_14395 [Candidatus Paceibacterota bacterium]|nr:hypothetical protein [Candidatus Paceibacterota bacterium]